MQHCIIASFGKPLKLHARNEEKKLKGIFMKYSHHVKCIVSDCVLLRLNR